VPFSDYFVPGLILLMVVGVGGVVTAVVNILDDRLGSFAALADGAILVGWILGELVFMTQTMVLTRVILATGVVLIALAAPGVHSALGGRARREVGRPVA
jgi:hypothetical protein